MGKKKIVTVLSDNDKDYSFLDVFKKVDATKDEVAHAGALYGANGSDDSLNKLRYTFYCKQLAKKCLTSQEGFQLQKLPPTSDATKYHSYQCNSGKEILISSLQIGIIHFNNLRWLPVAILNYKKASCETFRDSSDFKSRHFQVTFLKISAFNNFIPGSY